VTKRRLVVLLIAGACLLLSGCAVVALGVIGDGPGTSGDDEESDWVVVTYTLKAGAPTRTMDVLLETEMAADAALQDASAGSIDGNEVGAGEYQLYFVGPDRHRMWQVLERVLAKAPLKWTRVELYQTLGEEPDEVILPR
jgi:starvation-inducible outer membrane lipoprotein